MKRCKVRSQGLPAAASASQMHDGSSSEQFIQLLLRREETVYQLPARLAQGDGVIGWAERDREASWICSAARRLGLDIDSVTSAIAILDQVVCSTRVPAKYINCVAAACLHIAKKLWEDHEETTSNFLARLHLEYTENEIKRMETRILTLLHWDVQLPSISRFLDAILTPMGATYLVSPVRPYVEAVVSNWQLMSQFPPSTLSVSIVSFLFEGNHHNWLPNTQPLLRSLNVDVGEVSRCRDRIASLWERSLLPTFSSFGFLPPSDDSMDVTTDITTSTYDQSSVMQCSPTDMASPRALQPTPC